MKIIKRGELNKLDIGEQDQVLIIASTGHGKTLAIERIAELLYEKGFCVITLPSPKMNLELGYVGFPPEAKYHLDKLKFQQEKPTPHNFKLYHPYTNNFPSKRKLPNYNIFTLDIKRLDRFLCYFLFENTEETIALNLLLNTITLLKKDEGLFHLINKIRIKVNKNKGRDTFGVSATSGTQRELNRTIQIFQRFRYNPLIFNKDFKFNLNIKEILNDNKNYHIFDNRFILDAKERDFITLYILNEIKRVKEEEKTRYPVAIVLEELKSFAPASPIYNFKIPLNKILSEMISICRGLEINFLSSSQIYQEINSEVRESFNELVLGKMSALKDLFEISKVANISGGDRKTIMGLKNNEFFCLNLEEGTDEGVFLFHLPKHMHQERGYNFDKIFERYYPHKMKNFSEEVNYIKNSWKQQENSIR